jgi:tRNA (cytidine/uridine-2'-O-)-methyltransferase
MLGRLRTRLNVVLVSPDIPGNTGSIGRTVMAVGGCLHLVHPLGFKTDEKALRRAGLDYWRQLDLMEHESWDAFREYAESSSVLKPHRSGTPNPWLFTTHAGPARPHWEGKYRAGDFLIFGSETRGAPPAVHEWVRQRNGDHARVALPMVSDPASRSINLAAAVSAGLYEAVRQVSCAARDEEHEQDMEQDLQGTPTCTSGGRGLVE